MRCRSLLFVSAAIGLGSFAAGCGGTHGTAVAHLAATKTHSAASSTSYRKPPTKAALYAASACMRKHGVPNFPNPIFILGKYRFGFTVDSGVDNRTPRFRKAKAYCQARFLGGSKPFSPAQLARWQARALRYARCIRANGLEDFPDPPPASEDSLEGPEILLPSSLPQDLLVTPAWLHARRACKSLSAGIAIAWSG